MAISTKVKTGYYLRGIGLGVMMLVLGLWGLYDLYVTIPGDRELHAQFLSVQTRMTELQELRVQREAAGQGISTAEADEYVGLEQEMTRLAPGGQNPVPPSKFDELVQWMFILCLPFAPFYFVGPIKLRGKTYRLDDDGTLHGPEGSWPVADIADIDMGRWMAKSIADVVHTDGSRMTLDDFLHRDMEKIIGAIAHRIYPDQWDEQARKVKPDEAPASDAAIVPGEESGPGDNQGDGVEAASDHEPDQTK